MSDTPIPKTDSTITRENAEIWTITPHLMWMDKCLVQKWVSNLRNEEWRSVPVKITNPCGHPNK